ncbi:Type IV fimbriae expression regulatory protein PilR [Labilithrix luteola]|uniref:Type IV fimbriae expression regulatory protein PilR n=2 Tax=Labilithrix luteola TaxID=1391654 RepID=A0A0K1PVC6_9BACT|nr:Type IV fimbriae expression regulatory protein PilR [Labilithrix luteola]
MPTITPDAVALIVISGAAKGTNALVPGKTGGTLRVGKAPTNDLVLPDSTVSRHHFSVERTADGIRVVDAGSTNGLRVGGAAIKEAIVTPGTLLEAGDVQLLVGVEARDAVLPPSPNDTFGLARGTSQGMRRIFTVLERIAKTPASILLVGETGTGKDILARSIHAKSTREGGPFEVVDCGAIAGTLIESELFGHERGAFTGAVSARTGAFERAAGGTLFLDELGELPLELQPKLLRVLEAREFRRVGGSKTIAANVRIVAATTRDLAREVEQGRFREDLFFRLAVVTLDIPPLRSRREEIPLLVEGLLEAAGATPDRRPDAATLSALMAYDWPGNVRELRNVIERTLHLSPIGFELANFPPRPNADNGSLFPASTFDASVSYRENRARVEEQFERSYIGWLLERHEGNVSAAAREARMDRNHLTDLATKYNLQRRRRGG